MIRRLVAIPVGEAIAVGRSVGLHAATRGHSSVWAESVVRRRWRWRLQSDVVWRAFLWGLCEGFNLARDAERARVRRRSGGD